jgi:hypothetical protein
MTELEEHLGELIDQEMPVSRSSVTVIGGDPDEVSGRPEDWPENIAAQFGADDPEIAPDPDPNHEEVLEGFGEWRAEETSGTSDPLRDDDGPPPGCSAAGPSRLAPTWPTYVA